MGKGIVKLGEGNWAVKDGNLLAAKETNGRFKNAEFTVTRGTDATYVGKDGLIKTASFYNLVTYSEDFSEWNIGSNTTVTPNFAISPDGTQNATRFQTPTVSGSYLTLAESMTIGNDYTLTLYLKNNGGENIDIGVAASSTVGTKTAGVEVNLTNEWVRYKLNFTADSNSNFVFIDNISNANSVDCLIWGAQLVEGTEALDYQYTNGKEGIPRIDFTDNTDGHLLLEPQSTNLLTYSEDFDDSSWLKFATNLTITPNAIISPTGQTDASKLVSGSTNAQQAIYRNIIQSNCTLSVFAKKGEFDTIALKLSGSQVSKFDLSDGTIGYNTNVTPSIESVGNGWYRCSITIDSGSSAYAWIAIDTGNTQGDESSGIYIWGAQVEALPYATSHIPTNGSTVTRDGEIVQRESIDEIDIPQEEGTIYLELKGYEKNTEIFNLNRSTSNSIHVFTNSAGALRVIGYYEPEGTGTGVNATLDNNTSKVAIAFKNGSFIVYADGEEELNTSTFVWTPTTSIDRLYFNRGGYVASQGLSKVKALRIYKEAFNTTQLDELTS
jgi:hypothetical protein